MELILATESKFKIDIFKQEGFKVRAQASSEAEHYHDRSDPTKYVKEISRVKALSVAR
ncbi:MAG: hypothetical protein LBF15_00925 [Candidatus Peribacteria bacterium]|jgi:predicted house-cleaning NTP pyrophosphatase (Maf/HAM1 superfamily)|nr:hypothetical protein [Candidatus Peribacteria bacterium]